MSESKDKTVAAYAQKLGQIHEGLDLDAKLAEIEILEKKLKEYVAKEGSSPELDAFKKELIKSKNTYSLEKMDRFDKVKIVEMDENK